MHRLGRIAMLFSAPLAMVCCSSSGDTSSDTQQSAGGTGGATAGKAGAAMTAGKAGAGGSAGAGGAPKGGAAGAGGKAGAAGGGGTGGVSGGGGIGGAKGGAAGTAGGSAGKAGASAGQGGVGGKGGAAAGGASAGKSGAAGAGAAGAGTAGAGAAGNAGGVAGTGGAGTAGSAQAGAAGQAGGGQAGAGGSGPTTDGVMITLTPTTTPSTIVSFGVPVPPGVVSSAAAVRLSIGGTPVAGDVKVLLHGHDASGAATGVRALLVQIPSSALVGAKTELWVAWSGAGAAPGSSFVPFSDTTFPSQLVVHETQRQIQKVNGVSTLVETNSRDGVVTNGSEPTVLAEYPPGYLASTGLFGPLVASSVADTSAFAGAKFLSDGFRMFSDGSMYDVPYRVEQAAVIQDPVVDSGSYEGWLYDRCATYLTAYAHLGDAKYLRQSHRACSAYATAIDANGIFTGKPSADQKYSHLRGLYLYFALTGSEVVAGAGKRIADMWKADPNFVVPYTTAGPWGAKGIRGVDKLWTERLLGTSLEGLLFGAYMFDDASYYATFLAMMDTAYQHITTTDQSVLDGITKSPGLKAQNCFIHNAAQHAEGDTTQPWCSGWMIELLVPPLLAYSEQSGDPRADEIVVRLARFLRDVGSAYFVSDPVDDTFLGPQKCFDPTVEDPRRLVPLYGAGLQANGVRLNSGDFNDYEHCPDALGLTAAALRASKRLGTYDAGGAVGPFASEGASFLQMHHEFAYCAKLDFAGWPRPRRNPAAWTPAELDAAFSYAGGTAKFVTDQRIGWPVVDVSPARKYSWWFNTSMLQFGMLGDAGLSLPALTPGKLQPSGCP